MEGDSINYGFIQFHSDIRVISSIRERLSLADEISNYFLTNFNLKTFSTLTN